MSNEIDVVKPTVRISGADVSDMYCLRITKRIGIQPSTCSLRYIAGNDITGPVTLNRGSTYKHKQRVIVYDNSASKIWFHGWLTARQDQHKQNVELWTASDDTILMRDVPIRGCFYLDTLLDESNELKFSATLPTVFNPNGAWNCTGVSIGGVVYPVFTPTAVYGKAYESPDTDYSGAPNTNGEPEPWTPRRVLQYLQLVMHYDTVFATDPGQFSNPDRITGMRGNSENAINPDYLLLEKSHIDGLTGVDPGGFFSGALTGDPLDRSVQELSVQGDTLLGAMDKALKAAGTHELGTLYFSNPLITDGLTKIRFKPVGFLAAGSGKNIDIQFNGTVDDTYGTVFDFSLREDSIDATEVVVCEGEPVKVETLLEYDNYDTASKTASTIVPAWTAQNQVSFLACIYGTTNIGGGVPGTYAIFPKIPGVDLDGANHLNADGTNGTPIIRAGTPEAVALARQSYPTVFRAFALKVQGDLKDALEYPTDTNGTMIHPRPLLPEQLQFYTWLADSIGDTRLRSNLPIRLSISNDPEGVLEASRNYFDVPKDTAIRVTTDEQGDNLIWLDGSAEGADGTLECIYNGSLYANTIENIENSRITLRAFKLNAAMATDYRTEGLATRLAPHWLSTDYAAAFAGSTAGPERYLDRPGSFREHLQYLSTPAQNTTYYGGTDGTTELAAPLSREVPPGSEYNNATYAAQRELARRGNPTRTTTWMQAGIQVGFDAGDWIEYAYIWENGQNANNYLVNGVIKTVVYDFIGQTTRVGDVFSEFGGQV